MQTQPIGLSDLTVTRIGYGCWRLAGSEGAPARDKAVGIRAVHAALDAGITFFDHADIYGRGECESIFGQALRERPADRDRIVIATKCGIRPPWDGAQHTYDSSPAHITGSVEESLRRLGIERADLLMLHRPDHLSDPGDIAHTFQRLREHGKVRHFGVSNYTPAQLDTLQRACGFPLIAHQIEISLLEHTALHDGLLDQCLREKITPLAWSPLARGALLGAASDDPAARLHKLLDEFATKYDTPRAAIVLAWLLRHPAQIIPLIGTVKPERIQESTRADAIELTREEWYALLIAAQGHKLP